MRRSRTSADAWRRAKRILCIRLDGLGDLLMTTPALRALRGDGRRLTLLTSPAGAEAARLVPEVDDVIPYDAPWMKATAPRTTADAGHDLVRRLAAEGFDGAVIFTVYSQSPLPAALVCHLAGIPLRAAHCRENPYQLLTTWVPDHEPEDGVRHEARRQLDLAAATGAWTSDERLSLEVPPAALARVSDMLARRGLDRAGRWLVLHPGATAPSRRYPAERYAEAAGVLAREHGCQVVLSGSADEAELTERVRTDMGAESISLAGALDLSELAALLALAPLLVAGNTGPVHVAAAVGTPVVELYALTNPQHAPWGVPHQLLYRDVPCRWCYKSICPAGHHRCLRLVEPGEVVAAALEFLPAVQREPTLA